MGSISVDINYPSSVITEPGLLEVKGGQLGLFETGTTSS